MAEALGNVISEKIRSIKENENTYTTGKVRMVRDYIVEANQMPRS